MYNILYFTGLLPSISTTENNASDRKHLGDDEGYQFRCLFLIHFVFSRQIDYIGINRNLSSVTYMCGINDKSTDLSSYAGAKRNEVPVREVNGREIHNFYTLYINFYVINLVSNLTHATSVLITPKETKKSQNPTERL